MSHALIENGAVAVYPYSLHMLKRDHPDVSFPADPTMIRIEDYGVVKVEATNEPAPSSLSVDVVEDTPVFVDKVWRQAWRKVPANSETVAEREREAEHSAMRGRVKDAPFVKAFLGMTEAQLDAHVDANVTNIASSKVLLKQYGRMLLLLARREFGE